MAGAITVTIKTWDKWNYRRDTRNPSWFRFGHDYFEDPQFFDFTHADNSSWLYILCQISKSKSNKGSFLLNDKHLELVGRIKRKDFDKALTKLIALDLIQVTNFDVTSTDAPVTEKPKQKKSLADDSLFEAFWAVYPHKEGKGVAKKSYAKCLSKYSSDQIIQALEKYTAFKSKNPDRAWRNPSTFLNNLGDYLEPDYGVIESGKQKLSMTF
jgi:hypothetical protein